MRRKLLALIGIIAFVCACDSLLPTVRADVGNAAGSWSITATGVTPWLPLAGQNNCVFTITGSPAGLTLVPQVATDPAFQSVTTASSINTGSITGTGIYNGSVATLQPTAIRANVTGYTSGATQLSIVCGPGGGTGGGGGGSVTQGTSPWVVNTPAPLLTMDCTGTVGSHNLSCANSAGTVVCTNNAAQDSCTVTGTSFYLSMKSGSSAAQTVTLGCFNTTNTNPNTNTPTALLDANLLGITQSSAPGYGYPLTAANITCQLIAGAGSINAGGIYVLYH